MGLRELLILILILAIVAVVLRGLYVALSSRRGKIKIVLEKNVPEYDLEELEMRELPNGGARMVERSFAEVLRQNSAHAAKAHATATGKPSTLRPRARGLKTNLSRSAVRTTPAAASAIKSEPAPGQGNADELPLFAEREVRVAVPRERIDETTPENVFAGSPEEQHHARAAQQDFARDFEQDSERDPESDLELDLDQAPAQESAQVEEPILLAEEPAYQANDNEAAESDVDEIFAEEGFSVDGPLSGDDWLDAEQGSTEAPRYEDQDDPATYERSLAEEEHALFDEEPLINVGDGNFNEEMLSESEEPESEPDADWLYDNTSDMEEQETGEPVFNTAVDDSHGYDDDINDDNTDDDDMDEVIEEEELVATRRLREDEELDDVLDELLQPSHAMPRYESAQQPQPEPEYEPEPEPEPEYEPDAEPEPEYEPDSEPEPEYEPSRQPDTDPEPQPTYDPEPPPHYDPEPEPATRHVDDPLLDYSADDLEEGDTRVTGQTTAQPEDFIDPLEEAEPDPEIEYDEQQHDEQSDPPAVADDMPDFDNEYLADPEPQPAAGDSFGANRDDDMDVLFDDDDRERRIAALEEQQDSASRRFMSWAGGAFSRLGAGVAASKARAAEEAAERNEQKARKKQAQPEERETRQELKDVATPQYAPDLTDDYFDDDDAVSSVREQERPRATERRRAEQLHQSQLDLDVDEGHSDDGYNEGEQANEADTRSQEPPAYSEVLVLNVMARPGTEMMGEDVLPVLMSNGLRFGEMSIFHRHTDKSGGRKNGPVMFSVANALNPGTFDLNKISEFSTQGVCFFMTLPNVVNNMIAFEQMLATARNVQAALDAELKDDNRSVMTAQTVEHYRQRIRDFELQELKNAHAR